MASIFRAEILFAASVVGAASVLLYTLRSRGLTGTDWANHHQQNGCRWLWFFNLARLERLGMGRVSTEKQGEWKCRLVTV
jgi:hypothetical protein